MMMSKPKPEATSVSSNTSDTTAAAPKSDAIADLERRLADLSAATPLVPVTANPSPAPAAVAPTTTAATAPGNKNALLARIIAAQERAKQAQGASAPAPVAPAPVAPSSSFDFLSDPVMQQPPMSAPALPPPSFDSMLMTSAPPMFAAPPIDTAPPPPAFDDAFFAPPPTVQPPPPAFDSTLLPPPQMPSAPSHHLSFASAPSFEDLLMDDGPSLHHPPALLPPPVPPPASTGAELDDAALQAILGIEGLTQAEKQELINEQLKIMKSIEDSKKSAQVSAADAFEQRSFSAAVSAVGGGRTKPSSSAVLGMERTHQAIADGTAVVVQCSSCGEWMQVTGAAQFMMCSSCNTMTQVVPDAGMTSEEAQQMIADAKLAEQLQKEEYENADRAAASTRTSSPRSATTSAAPATTKASSSGTWMEWLGFGTPAPAPATRSNNIQLTYSRDSADDSADGLLGSPASQRRAGRVVTQQPLFACVTDSINSAATYAINTAQGIHEDEEGNVHGVDSSSLLAVTQVGRGSSNQSYEQMPGGGNDRV